MEQGHGLCLLRDRIAKSLDKELGFGVMVVKNWGTDCNQSATMSSHFTEEQTERHRRNSDIPKVTHRKAH